MSNILTRTSGKNLTFSDLKENLLTIKEARHDLIVSSEDLEVNSPAVLTTPAMPDAITEKGVGVPKMDWELTPHAFSQWCNKFSVPTKFLGNLADWDSPTAYMDLSMDIMNVHNKVEQKPILMRGIVDPDTGDTFCRAIVSPSYSIIENFDVLSAVFEGFRAVREDHGIGFEPGPASVSDKHMRARINMPQLSVVAEELLRDYKSPFTGNSGIENPVVFMGIEIRNSEVGAGAFTLVPSVIIQVCDNGMTLTNDIYRKVHLGSVQDTGVVSQRTMKATMELITSETIDKVIEIAHPDFIQEKVNELRGLKKAVEPKMVATYLQTAFDHELAVDIFDDFVKGGDISAFGVAQAITSFSQRESVTPDLAQSLDDSAIDHAKALA